MSRLAIAMALAMSAETVRRQPPEPEIIPELVHPARLHPTTPIDQANVAAAEAKRLRRQTKLRSISL